MKHTIEIALPKELEKEVGEVKKDAFKDVSDDEMFCKIIKMGVKKAREVSKNIKVKEGNYVS